MSKRKLLLADDSVTIQKVVNLTFADEGIEVITVGDGDSALEKISELSPDVILADVHMPGLSGYQICEIVRENPMTKNLPVVLLVGSFEPFDENEAARVGANAFLTKPFQSIRQLVTQVSDLMESAPAAKDGEADISFEDTDENLPTTASVAEVDEEAAPATAGRVPDTSDIESLYIQSFGSPAQEAAEVPSSHFVDAGMDDEMIETTHAGEPPIPTQQEFQEESSFDERSVSEDEYKTEPTAPSVSESEYKTEPTVPSPSESEYKTEPTVPSPFDSLAVPEEAAPIVEEQPQPEAYFDHFASTERLPTIEQQVSEAVSTFELDEVDLLELPPLENGKTVELTTKENVPEQDPKKQVMSLSPELMDVIVQKVVEKLSEK